MRKIRRFAIPVFAGLALVLTFGCNSDSMQDEQQKERRVKLWKGYGQEDTTSRPAQFKKIR